jgi:putative transcriptional regulator
LSHLSTRIKFYREKKNITQKELAEIVNVRRETIVNLENGKYNPSLKLGMEIAKVFDVMVEDVFELLEDESDVSLKL